jgi:hypothetical protein
LFFSWIACWRNKWAFLVYGLCWLAVFLGIDTLVSLLVLIGLSPSTAATIQVPLNVVATSVLYCSFYTSYLAVFDSIPAESSDETSSV